MELIALISVHDIFFASFLFNWIYLLPFALFVFAAIVVDVHFLSKCCRITKKKKATLFIVWSIATIMMQGISTFLLMNHRTQYVFWLIFPIVGSVVLPSLFYFMGLLTAEESDETRVLLRSPLLSNYIIIPIATVLWFFALIVCYTISPLKFGILGPPHYTALEYSRQNIAGWGSLVVWLLLTFAVVIVKILVWKPVERKKSRNDGVQF